MDTTQYLIEDAPAEMYYIADFLTEAEEQAMLSKVCTSYTAGL